MTAKVLPVIQPVSMARADDRRIAYAGLIVSAVLMALAIASLALPAPIRRGVWLPLHLALAGAAATAVASVMPFFTTTLGVAPPARRSIRIAAISFVSIGSLVIVTGVVTAFPAVATVGGLAYIAGLGAVAIAAFRPLGASLGPKRLLVSAAYGAALVYVVIGAATATAMLAGVTPIVERWGLLKPAHAWLNAFGFLSLVVAATLIHLAPTVAGTRIRPRWSSIVAVTCLAVGAPVIAGGFALDNNVLVRSGALVEVVGATALVWHGVSVQRDHGRWTTDLPWHRLTSFSLLAAPVWFLVATTIACARLLWYGAAPVAWAIDEVIAPLAIGWLAQVLVGASSHLLPNLGPGDALAHARARQILGRGAAVRLVALNVAVALLLVGHFSGSEPTFIAGLALAGSSGLASVALLLWAAMNDQFVGRTRAGSGGRAMSERLRRQG